MDGIPLPEAVPPTGPSPEDVHVLFQPPSQEGAAPIRKKGSVDGDGVETLWPPPPPPPPHHGYNYGQMGMVPPGYMMPPVPPVDYQAYYAQYYQVGHQPVNQNILYLSCEKPRS